MPQTTDEQRMATQYICDILTSEQKIAYEIQSKTQTQQFNTPLGMNLSPTQPLSQEKAQ